MDHTVTAVVLRGEHIRLECIHLVPTAVYLSVRNKMAGVDNHNQNDEDLSDQMGGLHIAGLFNFKASGSVETKFRVEDLKAIKI